MRFCERCRASFQSRSTCPRDRIPTRADIADPLLGAVVGERYRVLDRIAAGGMGQVYRASHVRIASLFAVKVLYGDLAYDAGMRARFQREAEATSLLSHRHIVRVFDFGETPEGLLYLAMEYVDGQSLAGLLARDGKLDEARAVTFARQITRGLAHAHERGIVHRDLKTDNVLVVREDEDEEVAKILDFGLAQIRSEVRLTQAGQVFGTPQYMAPEQFFRADVDTRADLYSLGVMLSELLTGTIPFDGATVAELARLHSQAPPPSVRASCPGVSAAMEAIIARLLAKSPDDRFPSARSSMRCGRSPRERASRARRRPRALRRRPGGGVGDPRPAGASGVLAPRRGQRAGRPAARARGAACRRRTHRDRDRARRARLQRGRLRGLREPLHVDGAGPHRPRALARGRPRRGPGSGRASRGPVARQAPRRPRGRCATRSTTCTPRRTRRARPRAPRGGSAWRSRSPR